DASRDVNVGWLVDSRFGASGGAGASALNEQILDALANGVSALTIAVGPGAVAPGDLQTVLRGVHLGLAPVALDAGSTVGDAADSLYALLDGDPPAQPGNGRVSLGASPLTDLFATGTEPLDAAAV